jgi:hypothetical protein
MPGHGLNVFQIHLINPDSIRLLRARVRQKGLTRFQMDSDIKTRFEGKWLGGRGPQARRESGTTSVPGTPAGH